MVDTIGRVRSRESQQAIPFEVGEQSANDSRDVRWWEIVKVEDVRGTNQVERIDPVVPKEGDVLLNDTELGAVAQPRCHEIERLASLDVEEASAHGRGFEEIQQPPNDPARKRFLRGMRTPAREQRRGNLQNVAVRVVQEVETQDRTEPPTNTNVRPDSGRLNATIFEVIQKLDGCDPRRDANVEQTDSFPIA
jgi:hypothetical protein